MSYFTSKIYSAGIVGAGGAGFPTHVKMNAKVEILIVNAAECEPLLYKDKEILRLESNMFLSGLVETQKNLSPKRTVIGIKEKYQDLIKLYTDKIALGNYNIEIFQLKDVYPAGDEVELVFEITNRVVPQGGIPLNVGCVVSNVETFYNIGNAIVNNTPVVDKIITITGAVDNPVTLKVPIGVPARYLIEKFGKPSLENYSVISGGVMMGYALLEDEYITKTSAGYIVLPNDSPVVTRKTQSESSFLKIGKSSCDQCSYCTEFCPRFLLGHEIQPHRVMRTLQLSGPNKDIETRWATWCSGCSLCNMFSCPEGLQPKLVIQKIKSEQIAELKKLDYKKTGFEPHPMRDYRRVPSSRLMSRLGITRYNKPAHWDRNINVVPDTIVIQTRQHIGMSAVPAVKKGDRVERLSLIASVPENKLGANIHSPMTGIVEYIDAEKIIIKRV